MTTLVDEIQSHVEHMRYVLEDAYFIRSGEPGDVHHEIGTFPSHMPVGMRDEYVRRTREWLAFEHRARERRENLGLAEVPDAATHASWQWCALRSGSRARTRAMLDALGLTVVLDVKDAS